MSAPVLVQPDPLARAQDQQRRAADPERSVWVAASAGTGKTKVLTDRVLALLLTEIKPARILCLTFTRAAAAEMAVRLRQRLAAWSTAADDAALIGDIEPMLGRTPRKDELALARRLFGTVLDAPGGLRIQTLHGFCESLLGRFPIEAGIAPHFEVIDERTSRETLVAARDAVLRRARTGEQPLADVLNHVTGWVGEDEFAELFAELARMRGRIARLLHAKYGLQGVTDAIYRMLGVSAEESESAITAAACEDAALELAGLRAAANVLLDGRPTDRTRGQTLADWLAAPATRVERFKSYSEAFLTKEGAILKVLITKSAAEAAPIAAEVLLREARRVLAVVERCRSIQLACATVALLTLGDALLKEYAARKDAAAALDYDDLVLKTRDLLADTSDAQWVLYKLDNGIDHILIDEAQDTSADQWAVVRALSEEFFASESDRTLFAVGDPKQSIFSFQGADPAGFGRMRAHFAAHAETARAAWDDIALDVSFRSVPAVLSAVDAVFAHAAVADGVVPLGDPLQHRPSRAGEPGLVELWPCAPATETEEPAPWLPPRAQRDASADAKLAKLIATRIYNWRKSGELLESEGRPIRPGDVMVLVARRTRFIENLVRELKARDVAVAGIDRMVLTDQLPVMDLVALGNALLLPEDDLNLATVLKSPLFGLSEDQMFALCHRRDGTVWRALESRAGDDPTFAAAHAELAALLARADYVPPYELYAEILGARGGRRKLVARLGFEANDPIDEFLGQALAYERAHPPSLQGFLTWLVRGNLEVKRDLEQGGRDEVRIMTVHGAKGLQAPIVFLPDTMNVPQDRTRILWDGDNGPFLWAPRRDVEDATAARLRDAARAQQEQERRRLLYVAMTRACDRLYVCGWETKNAAPDGCWHRLIRAGLQDVAEPARFDFTAEIGAADGWAGDGLRLEQRGPAREKQSEKLAQRVPPLPMFAYMPAPAEPRAARPLTPSRMDADAPAARSPVGDEGARARGRIIHTLLEHLPTLATERRSEAAARLIAKHAPDLGAEAAGAMARAICDLIAAPAFAPLFGEDSLAEVPIVGRIGDAVIAGQVDRLVVTSDRVLIVDYKSGQPPKRNADTPRAYMRQLAAYRAVLAGIYPGRPISCAILWTTAPALIEIAPADLDVLSP